MTLPEEIKTENDLVAAVGLMFFDSMSVKCDASSYARYVIDLVRAFDADLVAALGAPVAPATAVEAMRAKCEAIALRLATHPDPTWARAAGLVANEIRALTPSDRSERAAPAEPFPGSPDEGLRANQ